ncbi:acyltransferase family protein [Leifsonia sp. Root112D2]|uniref:acyltransferase family protein n=1 Tax=Leifsonia sp. Root112D2 TaxID=1736426 RepID=UPI0006F27643|nr:acyltransferase [Leifsonia sp. Root112D2]KQV06049.1 hypothetical protein ASC63_00670 [Leifsonia sp. Root112D2]
MQPIDSRQTSSPRSGTNRLIALDGLRGIAALVVLAHHAALTNPNFPGNVEGAHAEAGSLIWWFSYTPLKLLTAGSEAVIVFFVLSGLVVTLPVLKRRGFDWIAYFPRRVVRLGVPVVASVLVAAAFVFAIPQRGLAASGTWLGDSSTPTLTWKLVVEGMDLVGGDGQINNPLWSLRWEMLFSLALPVFVLLAMVLKRWWMAGIAAAVLLTWLGVQSGSGALSYFPAFFVGAIIAARLDAVRAFADRLNDRRGHHLLWFAITAGGGILLISSWFTGLMPTVNDDMAMALRALTPLAAAMLVVSCIGWSVMRGLLSTRPLQFVGKISFSLYLVHVPILIFTSYLIGGRSWYAAVSLAAVLALLVATGFWWLIESRSHGWAKRLGAWASKRYALAFGTSVPARSEVGVQLPDPLGGVAPAERAGAVRR